MTFEQREMAAYKEFTSELGKLGFDNEDYHLPYLRIEPPQMIVGWVANPQGIQLQVKRTANGLFELERIEYINMYETTLNQIKFTIERFSQKQE